MAFIQHYVRKTVQAQNYVVHEEVKTLFQVLTYVCKVRGYTTIVKFFPHEVADMEFVTELLHFQHEKASGDWQVPYILTLWLSIIVLVPFDLTSIDSQKNQEILVKRLINIGRNYICFTGKLMEGAAVMLAKLVTRPDVVKSGETDLFLNQMAIEYTTHMNDYKEMIKVAGILQTFV